MQRASPPPSIPPSGGEANQVVVNELMYHPATESDDEWPIRSFTIR